ncbi:MAG: hypothetical protein WC662_04360 [Candidatus Paceibacterota bacterium]|jgi:hypothetical protein
MPLDEREKLNKIEEMKSRLFSKNYTTKIEHRNNFAYGQSAKEVADSWQKKEGAEIGLKEKFFTKTSVFKKFFIFSVVFFVLALGYAGYMFFAGGNTVSNKNIEISVLGNTFTAGGEELSLQIEIVNKNNSLLELADLIVEYSKSSSEVLSPDSNLERLRVSLGAIPAGSVRSENVKIVLFGEQGSIRDVKISLEYRVEGSNAIFVKEKLHQVTISSAPLDLTIDAPQEVSSNQDIILNIKAALNATKPASKILIKLDYPVGFQFTSATPMPSFGNNVWNLGDLAPGSENKISIVGKMIDVFDGEEKTFHIWSGSQSETDKSAIETIFNSIGHTVLIKKHFIEANLSINGASQREVATDGKNLIHGEIRWINNLDTKIGDLEIRAKISGNAINRKTISANQGFYNSIEDTIVWDRNTLMNLKEVGSGIAGSVSFSFSSLPVFSGASGMILDPTINVEVSVSGKQLLEGNILKTLTNSESKIIKIISDVGLAGKVLYYSGPFANSGPIPPKAEQETIYTVVWTISNTVNNISKAKVFSTLPSWARFVGPISPPAEDLVYNPSSKEITWNIGGISRGTGIMGESKEVAFQIAIIPSISQVGSSPYIINDAILTGHDDFANVDIRVNKGSLNTKLMNDLNTLPFADRVVE